MKLWSSFRFRLGLVFLLAALVPLLVISGVSLRVAERYLADQAVREHQAVLAAITSGVSLYVSSRGREVEVLSASPIVQGMAPGGVEVAFSDFLVHHAFFDGLYAYDANGRVVAVATRHGGAGASSIVGSSVSTLTDPVQRRVNGALAQVLAQRQLQAFSDVEEDGGRRLLLLVVPILDFVEPNRARGALAAVADFDSTEVQDILASYPIGVGDYVCVLDGTGTIVARTGTGLPASAHRFVLPTRLRVEGTGVVTVSVDTGNRTDLLSVSYLGDLGGYVAMGQPARRALGLVRALRENTFTMVVFALFLVAIASAFLAWTIARPITALTDGLTKVRQGTFSHRVDCTSDDEVGQAGVALNALADTLQRKMVIGTLWERIEADRSSRG